MPLLLVVNHPQLRAMLRKLLIMRGLRLIEAEDAAGALAILGELGGAAALAISDYRLAHRNGAHLARQVKQQFPGLRVLLMSSTASPDDCPLCDGILRKPFTPADLVEAIHSQTRRSGTIDESESASESTTKPKRKLSAAGRAAAKRPQ
jgi:DNA-binding NarL/FixJ family response regulator